MSHDDDDLGLGPIAPDESAHRLIQRRGHVLRHAEQLLEEMERAQAQGKEPGPKLQARYDARMAEVEALSRLIATREAFESTRAAVHLRKTYSEDVSMYGNPSPSLPGRTRPDPHDDRNLRAFANTREGREDAYASGRFLMAALHQHGPSLQWVGDHFSHDIRMALSGGVNTAGGVLVPEEFEREVIKLREEYGVCRRLMRVRPMGSDTKNIPRRVGGVTAYFVSENAEGTESDASWDNVLLSAKKLMVLTRMSSEIAEDSIIDLADDLADEIAYSFALKEDQCGLTGTGTSTYGGIVGALVKAIDGSHALAKVSAASGHDTAGEITLDDLLGCLGAVPAYAKPGSVWLCSTEMKSAIFDRLRAAAGGITAADISAGFADRFLGYPIIESQVMPSAIGATTYNGTVMLGFGNLAKAASIGGRRGITVALSDQRYWSQDQIGVKGTERFDINVHDLGTAAVKSPFVVLCGLS